MKISKMLGVLFIISLILLSGCDNFFKTEDQLDMEERQQEIYAMYKEAKGSEALSYDEWIASIAGKDGIGIKVIDATKKDGKTTITVTLDDGTKKVFTIEDGKDSVGIDKIETVTIDGVTTVTLTLTNGEKTSFEINDGAEGSDGVGISKIEKTAEDGLDDIYTVTLSNGSSYNFTVTNAIREEIPVSFAIVDGNLIITMKDSKKVNYGKVIGGSCSVEQGVNILSISRSGEDGTGDVYTITLETGESYQFIVDSCEMYPDDNLSDLLNENSPNSLIADFKAKNVIVKTTNAYNTAIAKFYGEYINGGVLLTIDVNDYDLHINDADRGLSDNIEFNITGINSPKSINNNAFNFLCSADGKIWVRKFSSSGIVEMVIPNVNYENDYFYYKFNRTSEGYSVNVFVSYTFLNVGASEGYNNVRIFPMLRNTSSLDTQFKNYESAKAYYSHPYTWPKLNSENAFVRTDFMTPTLKGNILVESGHSDLDFLESMANISPVNDNLAEMMEVKVGSPLFKDRSYCYEESMMPVELNELSYLFTNIDGKTSGGAKVVKAGYVLLVAMIDPNENNRSLLLDLAKDNWTLISQNASPLARTVTNGMVLDTNNYYVKWCEEGEVINYSKWNIVMANSEEVKEFAWHTHSAKFYTDFSDYYALDNRIWQGVPAIAVTNNNTMLSAYMTGDKSEPAKGNYFVLSISKDNGTTWNEVAVMDTYFGNDVNKDSKISDVQMVFDDATGKLHFYYATGSYSNWIDKNYGIWHFTVDNPDADFAEWNFSKHKMVFTGLLKTIPLKLADGTWLATPDYFLDDRYVGVYASTDDGESWQLRGKCYMPDAWSWDEVNLVQLSDGRLWMTARTAVGYVAQAFSSDDGYTWTISSNSKIPNPDARIAMINLSSGNILMVYNNTNSGRKKMTAALSTDDGKTWAYQVELHALDSSYPIIDQSADGKIHVVFDNARGKGASTYSDDYYKYWGRVYYYQFDEAYLKEHNGEVVELSDLRCVVTLREALNAVTLSIKNIDGSSVSDAIIETPYATFTSNASGKVEIPLSATGGELALTINASGYHKRVITIDSKTKAPIYLIPTDATYFGEAGGNKATKLKIYGLRTDDSIYFVGLADDYLASASKYDSNKVNDSKLEVYIHVNNLNETTRTTNTYQIDYYCTTEAKLAYKFSGSNRTYLTVSETIASGMTTTIANDMIIGKFPYAAFDKYRASDSTFTMDSTKDVKLQIYSIDVSQVNGGTNTAEALNSSVTTSNPSTYILWAGKTE